METNWYSALTDRESGAHYTKAFAVKGQTDTDLRTASKVHRSHRQLVVRCTGAKDSPPTTTPFTNFTLKQTACHRTSQSIDTRYANHLSSQDTKTSKTHYFAPAGPSLPLPVSALPLLSRLKQPNSPFVPSLKRFRTPLISGNSPCKRFLASSSVRSSRQR